MHVKRSLRHLNIRTRIFMTDLCVEDGKGFCCVQWDEDSDQELLMFGLQRQGEAVYDAAIQETRRKKHLLYML